MTVPSMFSKSGEEKLNSQIYTDIYYNVWLLLHQTRNAILRAREKELSKYNISSREAAVLFAIRAIGDNSTPAQIARWIFREPHTVSALINRMERKGLVKKEKDTCRKNVWLVTLTEKGGKAYQQSIENRETFHTIISSLTKSECRRLELYLRKLRDRALQRRVIEPTIPFP